MTKPLVLAMPGSEDLAGRLNTALPAELGRVAVHVFPDGESLVRIEADVSGRTVVLACSLHDPDQKFLPLAFAAATARDLGAHSVGLAAPYLAYMRQDMRFHDGEAVTSVHFARMLGDNLDWLATVDPHLHRHHSLGEIYGIPTAVAHAAPSMAEWIRTHVERPLILGPDEESEQWVSQVAAMAGAPYRVCLKKREGDREVSISLPEMTGERDRTPVLVDDIVSSGRTIVETSRRLQERGFAKPIAVAVHYLARGAAAGELEQSVSTMVSTNSVPHPTNRIDITPVLATACRPLLQGG